MHSEPHIDPANRQVLINLGNRFVVFGSEGGLPESLRFNPADSPILLRVADESEGVEARLVEALQVFGMTGSALSGNQHFGACSARIRG
jgi:hypothetical protein